MEHTENQISEHMMFITGRSGVRCRARTARRAGNGWENMRHRLQKWSGAFDCSFQCPVLISDNGRKSRDLAEAGVISCPSVKFPANEILIGIFVVEVLCKRLATAI